ncbi:MAG: hypothetical protein U9R50_03930 [Campylobacterota bacterium]|nr:hypothetical protein [Campylobacterota bacterium]
MQRQFLFILGIIFIFSGCATVVSSPEHNATQACVPVDNTASDCHHETKTVVYKSSRCSYCNFPVSVRKNSDCQGGK